ncbi:MAG: hypothetical protein A3G93_00685 [Nitrospinae bacterium RIFCSPLOWO2_12_FULL_45_22]|nr:MAG: hypothetical protein A3G93_00685 [Nitrospinae bacterium RIFCSPLOWO2_12_FULL_45_22]
MFGAYFDESGVHRDSPVVVVAGFLAPDKQWARLQSEWDKALKQTGISFFHMVDYENRQKQFKDWKEDERIERLKKFLEIIKRRITIPVVAAVGVKDYKEAALWQRDPGAPQNAYAFCALMCLQAIAAWADKVGHREPIGYIFEDGALHKGELLKLADQIKKDPARQDRYRWVGLSFTDKRYFSPLQATDILAYEAYKEARVLLEGQPRAPRKSFAALLRGMVNHPEHCRYFRKQDLLSGLPYVPPTKVSRKI